MELIGGFDLPLWSILLTLALLLGYVYFTWTFTTWSKQGISGPRPLPLFGTFLSTIVTTGGVSLNDTQLVKKYGKLSGSYRGRVPVLNVADPEFLRLAMIKDFSSMENRQDSFFGNTLDCFLTSLTDDHWKHVRACISPTFTSGKLKQLKARIDVCANQFVKYVADTKEKPFDLKKLVGGYTMDTISSTAFGVDLVSLQDEDHPMIVNANRAMGTNMKTTLVEKILVVLRIFSFILLPNIMQRWLSKFGLSFINMEALSYFEDLSNQIITERGQDDLKQKDFVQLCTNQLIDEPALRDPETQVDKYGRAWSTKGLTKDEVVANAVLFFMAGYETTALTLHYVLYELTINPDIQKRVYEEITTNMSGEEASYDELSKMEYVDWVLQEAMRLYPAALRLERLVGRDTTVAGVHLSAGSMVSALVYPIHHDPEIWPDPEKFDPERFSPENREGRHQYAWIPFGLGNRNCIGMRLALLNMKIAMVKTLKNYVLEPCEGTPTKPLTWARNFRMDPEKPIMISAKRRAQVTQP
ncbi:lithocholate 6-beta-hydroxylase-like isoform X2 [Watersipora subatra]|uniref:lithocholate 6-beta-hydroxylase-like isoform X2 n=1 Tax=Watersipora subatra TaxID=2589382 RepID=UPI00355B3C2D